MGNATELIVTELSASDVAFLIDAATGARRNARILGKTPVGAAVLSNGGNIFAGCNVEHRYRSHDVHAEVNALTTMVAAGDQAAVAVAVASNRDHFSPCGGCMDWIFELGGPDCLVLVSNRDADSLFQYTARQLMPFYPH